ncbi:ABC transporter ATP-binding protein [Bradyrhizobium septentrionale]|uniref:ABC transporter ATP-binding protein n=1 Tax=Bradyrhizobium septentrionale TaxID=1404411 RepID=A0ABZ2PEJ9_9BRAD
MTSPDQTNGPLLVCEGVTKTFGSLRAVDGLSLTVRPGEVVGLGGPNGAGKTTFFDVVTAVTPITDGRIQFAGRDITGLAAHEVCRAGIARTFQLNAAFDSLSVEENIEVAAHFGDTNSRFPGFAISRAARQRAAAALDLVGLSGRRRIARDLPVLDRKLLMMAGAVATSPQLLLLDEPVGGLSPSEVDRIADVVKRLSASGIAILLIEHVMRFLLSLSTRVVIMHHGRSIFEGAPSAVADDPTVVETYLGKAATNRLKAFFVKQPELSAHG